ncbi:putative nitroreductase [Legionella gratiana]|uniref:Nitroreductase n=1 Tax=Legionella gratiana TaxID=45066 RepID=A0A378JCR8_9GAMM|nr:SagB/ThcOx family dehydrogenase [Legionella gratiana]KTD10980.1 putative nitroreductase [Legionella gratiana]STX44677.1 putative nitroreductase [Legionella gratiana]
MDKFFWFSLPITLMIAYLLFRAVIGRPMKRRDINMISAIYLIFYLLITAGLGLFWVARMDLPAFDLHYLFGYCLLFLVAVHLWFQFPLVLMWLKKNSPSVFLDETGTQWKPSVRKIALINLIAISYLVITVIVYEFMTPATTTIIESNPEIPNSQRIWFKSRGEKINSINYIHHQGDITRRGGFRPRFNFFKPDEFKSYPHHPVVVLPEPGNRSGTSLTQGLSQEVSKSAVTLNIQSLSNVLYYADGVTKTLNYPGGQLLLRAAASAGALYPNDLYVAVINVEGLSPGIYYYHPANHSLTKISNQESLQSLSDASPYRDIHVNASAIIIIASNFDRTNWKYYERSFRYILPDAGHILGNLTLVASSMQIPYISTAFFDDEKMKNVLGLSQQDEGVLSMVVLGKNKLTALTEIPQFTVADLPKEIQDIELTRLSYQVTSVQWKIGTRNIPKINMKKNLNEIPADDALIQLPDGSAADEDVFSIIKNRRSFRQFSKQEVSLEDFTGILQQSFAPLRNPHIVEEGRRVELYTIVSNVKGLSKGVYRYIPEKIALEQIRAGNFSKRIYEAGLSQELLERAAFVIAWSIDLNKIGLLHGERDYRYANLESGIGGAITYLAAQARGLGTCAVGAFYDDELRTILKINGTEKYIILLTAVGHK